MSWVVFPAMCCVRGCKRSSNEGTAAGRHPWVLPRFINQICMPPSFQCKSFIFISWWPWLVRPVAYKFHAASCIRHWSRSVKMWFHANRHSRAPSSKHSALSRLIRRIWSIRLAIRWAFGLQTLAVIPSKDVRQTSSSEPWKTWIKVLYSWVSLLRAGYFCPREFWLVQF